MDNFSLWGNADGPWVVERPPHDDLYRRVFWFDGLMVPKAQHYRGLLCNPVEMTFTSQFERWEFYFTKPEWRNKIWLKFRALLHKPKKSRKNYRYQKALTRNLNRIMLESSRAGLDLMKALELDKPRQNTV